MTLHITAKKITICLSCCSPFVSGDACANAKCKGKTHTFDSQAEMHRYVALKGFATNIKVQYPTPVFIAELAPETEGFNNKLPDFIPSKTIKLASTYKIDFYYYDPNSHQGLILEEFKPSMKKNGKIVPIYDEGARIKLKILAASVAGNARVQIAYPDKSIVGGYGTKIFSQLKGEKMTYSVYQDTLMEKPYYFKMDSTSKAFSTGYLRQMKHLFDKFGEDRVRAEYEKESTIHDYGSEPDDRVEYELVDCPDIKGFEV